MDRGVSVNPLNAEAQCSEVDAEQRHGYRVLSIASKEIRRERHERQSKEESEIAPGQTFVVAAKLNAGSDGEPARTER